MVQNTHGLHHFHKRRIKLFKFKKIIDKIIYVIAVLGPIITLPQIFEIWIGKDATGVSTISWGFYTIFAAFWLVYGIIHKEKPIIVANIFWVLLDLIVVIGSIIY